jgi:hypothetical protein
VPGRFRCDGIATISDSRFDGFSRADWRQFAGKHRLPKRCPAIRSFAGAIHLILKFSAYRNWMHERRAQPRQRVFKAGTIEFDGTAVNCTVRNLSSIGAGLEVENATGIPHEITLNIRSCEARRHGFVVWRRERRIGIAFGNA